MRAPEGSESLIRILVSGRVQGVGYRYFARRSAVSLGIRGFVRNLDDGRVEVVAMGPDRSVQEFIQALIDGPASAHVSGCHVEQLPSSRHYSGFTIES